MNIKLHEIEGGGDISRERVVIKATAPTDIGKYAVFACRAGTEENTASAGPINAVYWFPNKKVQEGDFIVLYSKLGTRSEKRGEDGNTSHFFYWRSPKPLWVTGTVPALVETSDWHIGKRIK